MAIKSCRESDSISTVNAPIIALINAKGGSGATTLAVEVAKMMKRSGSVAVVDGDLTGRRNMAVILDVVSSFNNSRNSGSYSVIQTQGMTALEMTDSLDNSFLLRNDDVDKLVDSLMHHDAIVIDAPQPFAAAMRPFIMRCSRFILVLEPNLLGTAAARTLLGDLQRFGIPIARISIVTNLRGGRSEIGSRELERALGVNVLAEIPLLSDKGYMRAIEMMAQRFAMISAEPPLEALRPSTNMPAGSDRRSRNASANVSASSQVNAATPNGTLASMAAIVNFSARDKLKAEIHEALAKRIDIVAASRAHSDVQKMAELRAQIAEATGQLLAERSDVASIEEAAQLRQEIIDEVMGYGPLEDLMRDPAVSEIMVNGPNSIYIERNGLLSLTNKRFVDDKQLRLIIERIIAPLGRRIDEASPMVDARLPDGSRVNAIIEPLALNGATLTIRRFGTRRLDMDDLVRLGAVGHECVNLLRAMVQARLNIVVSGGTGSGKTTFLNILSGFLPNSERIVTIEDAAEIQLKQEHVVRLESRPPNIEGRGAITIRDLVRNALRMRPDRIVIGECRGGEALDMLQAMNTGHDGSLTTVHANTPRDAISRLETLVLMSGFELPVRAIREQIAAAVDVIIQTARFRDGSRKIISISEVVGMEGDVVTMQEVVRYKQSGVDADRKVLGEFQYTGVQPNCIANFDELGIDYDVRELARMPAAGALW
jgi:pilus assembly protein CpaF